MYEYKARLERVIDGDTIDVIIDLGFDIHFKQRIRLYGINTPETRTRDLEEKKRGFAAKARLIELIGEFDFFTIQTKIDKKGKYGRVLGTIFIPDAFDDWINVNETLLTEGHAVEYK